VGEAVRFFKLDPAEDLLVIVDEIALPVGHVRIREKGSAGGHNGLSDIDRALGGVDYPRLRIGVGGMPPGWIKSDWVLSRFADEELGAVKAGTAEAADAAECVVREGLPAAMNKFNKRVPQENPTPNKPGPDAPSVEGRNTDQKETERLK
jgi:PTH1 family peptidyl-tRNA hydrolase